jgi:hypothetical protein
MRLICSPFCFDDLDGLIIELTRLGVNITLEGLEGPNESFSANCMAFASHEELIL